MTPRPPPRQIAPYGLACMHCFKSKCRCVSRPSGDGCERCHRLQKQCHPSDPLRRNTAWRKKASNNKTSSLEGKVDSLMTLLNQIAQSPSASNFPHLATRADGALSGLEHQLALEQQVISSSAGTFPTPWDNDPAANASGTGATSTTAASSSPSIHGPTIDTTRSPCMGSMPSSAEDCEACLAAFRDSMLPTFAFIDLGKGTTASRLHRDRPFLLRAIIAVASPSKEQKIAQSRELKRILAQAVVVQNQSSIDLLLGLLVFTAWSYDHVFTQSSSLSRLMMMAMSIACDLRLDKQLPPDEHMIKPMVDGNETWAADSKCLKPLLVSEEKRAVLACFTLSSMISIYFAQLDAMKWKPRMDESLRALEANKECPADMGFALQVRLQILAQKAVQAREQQQFESGPINSVNLYVRTLQTEVSQVEDSLSSSLRQNGPLMLHLRYIELCTNDTARSLYSDPSRTRSARPNSSFISSSTTLSYDLFDFSWRSVNAIKAWIDIFLSLMPAEVAGLSFIHAAQLARCLLVLYRLSTMTSPGWDNLLVRRTIDLMAVLGAVAEKYEVASRHLEERSPDDLFMRVAGMMRKCYRTAATKMEPSPTMLDDTALIENGAADSISQSQALLQPLDDDFFFESIFEEIGMGWSA